MTTERSGMSLALAHCPFCGRIPEVVDQDGIAWVECRGCNCEGPDDETAALAIEKWNSRYPSPPSDHLSRDAVAGNGIPVPVSIDRTHENRAFVTLGFAGPSFCTGFIKAANRGFKQSFAARPAAVPDGIEIAPTDLIFEAWPKDPGGMRVYNPRGVMVTHKPTGCVCTCTSERSQHKNRDVALAGIKAMLAQRDGGK